MLKKELILETINQYQTPCFIYDFATISENYKTLKSSLPDIVDVFYSIKANPAIALIHEIYKMGAGVELCSYFEIEAAILAGVLPQRIIFVGPGKSALEIEKCLSLGIYAIVCESESELDLISVMAGLQNRIASVALRINPLHSAKMAALKMGGQSLPFGIDEEIIFEKIENFMLKPNIRIIGIHVYHGTRILDVETIAENTRYIFSLARKIQEVYALNLEFVDIGGGLGVPYFSEEQPINFDHFSNLMHFEIQNYVKDFPASKIILEVGRFMVANSGVFISRILDIKVSRGRSIMVTDGGMNCFMLASLNNPFLNRNFAISLISHNPSEETQTYTITGPLCTPSDVLGREVCLPEAQIGDYILIHNAGAYGPSASPGLFLSHGFPAEILYKNGKIQLIRARFSTQDFFQNQTILQEETI